MRQFLKRIPSAKTEANNLIMGVGTGECTSDHLGNCPVQHVDGDGGGILIHSEYNLGH